MFFLGMLLLFFIFIFIGNIFDGTSTDAKIIIGSITAMCSVLFINYVYHLSHYDAPYMLYDTKNIYEVYEGESEKRFCIARGDNYIIVIENDLGEREEKEFPKKYCKIRHDSENRYELYKETPVNLYEWIFYTGEEKSKYIIHIP